ncbi:hypothetical protein BS50DRAFT_621135 [Corynespora cassiicola Philippines]|uniref:CFEM domain-containing protein n=1 Tax=Corynespora cassiicola Philippines TaxID=1448308 RepID=A0A2T2NNN9_CORCC|nr:hypothetical protein BS50DRAFT_621135 [Corynespora cassiicola Philippines]
MTPFRIVTIFLAALFLGAANGSLTDSIDLLPGCATECLFAAIGESACGLTNQTCVCMDMQLQSSVEACVMQACTTKQALTTKNVTTTACGAPIRDRSGLYKTISNTMGIISAACVLLRLVYKMVLTMSEIGLDDWFILITCLSGVPSSVINVHGMAASGLGRDVWTLDFEKVTSFARWFYIMEVLYFAQVTLLKLSLLFFYHRIFPGRPIRRVILGTVLFNILFGAIFVMVAIFQCQPISYYWHSWHGEHAGKCININALGWSNAAISIALDLWMLAIPLSQLFGLKMGFKKKISVALMFCVGTFVTVVSILRLQSLVHFASSKNPTHDQWDVSVWSTVEINVGIMCACMPALRVMLVRLLPGIMGSTRNASAVYYAKYGSNSRRGMPGQENTNPNASRGEGRAERRGAKTITYTRTVEIHSATDPHHDETALVQMDELTKNGSKATTHDRDSL